ncbi:hypothetical protein PPTG_19466 [Phytophthora nicotianae INRA-310]|uniref:Uncharacterized protein n=1 Tax=Phytophthora nicotianae (strain INRA-310) TaxID=761204 RepID=W2PEY8_PHYN3|nr:hypothetical protein PPTG_19466 [Phytophthora nicotianae INRA-310]ETM98564.1 hypothetical protein PPTG_19466 [Phytophthora nicotianae INRA-310]
MVKMQVSTWLSKPVSSIDGQKLYAARLGQWKRKTQTQQTKYGRFMIYHFPETRSSTSPTEVMPGIYAY